MGCSGMRTIPGVTGKVDDAIAKSIAVEKLDNLID
jgi:hypothetical protein